jgi:hypothetical protein
MKTTNELKKGTRIKLKNGWYATLMDNKKGNIRLAEVEGIFTEIGSIYASEIAAYELESGYWEKPVLTDKQKRTIVLGGF